MKRILPWAFALLLLAALTAAGIMFVPRLITSYNLSVADAAEAEGRLGTAIERLLAELDRYPKDNALRLRVVGLYEKLGNYGRAEYLLVRGMREQGGQTELYVRLSGVYVKQDKLSDAIELMRNPPNPNVKSALDKMRPAPPSLDPPPGEYEKIFSLSVTSGGAACYLSADGSVPSVESGVYVKPITFADGEYEVRAVAVSADGLVSDVTAGKYSLRNLEEVPLFKEPVFAAFARAANGGAPVTAAAQTARITELIIEEPFDVSSLDDLKWFPALETLSLRGLNAGQADISALAGLTNLKRLTLTGTRTDSFDISALAALTSLEELDLSGNFIAGLDSLSELTKLKKLNLSGNSIADISPLAALVNLTELDLSENGISDTLPLKAVTKLTSLNVSSNRVRDVSGLRGMTALETLNLADNSAMSAEPLSGLSSLKRLDLSYNPDFYMNETVIGDDGGESVVNTLVSVGMITSLEYLDISGCRVDGAEPLAGLSNLQTLIMNDNKLTSIAGADTCYSLKEISFDHNRIKSLLPLKLLPAIERIHLEYNGLPSLVAIKDIPTLKEVYAFGNPLTESVAFTAPGVRVYTG